MLERRDHFDCNIEAKCERDKGGQRDVEKYQYRWKKKTMMQWKMLEKVKLTHLSVITLERGQKHNIVLP